MEINDRRSEPRYTVSQFELKGTLVLSPDPQPLPVQFENISSTGAGIKVLVELSPDQSATFLTLIAASNRENFVPIQLFFNNVRIPVNVVNQSGENMFGVCLSKHQKLLEMAEKGRQFLQMVVDAAVKRGATETDFIELKPPEIVSLKTPISEPSPVVPPTVTVANQAVGAPPAPEKPPEEGAPKSGSSELYKDLPPKHPMIDLIKMRYDAFNRKVFLLRSLGPHVAPYYIGTFVDRDSDMAQVLGGNVPLQKKTVYRWVTNELNLLIGGIDKRPAGVIENYFKQAIYAYMRKRKQTDITFDDIVALLDGKIKDQYKSVRNSFLESVSKLIDGEVQKRFTEYRGDAAEDNLKSKALKEEELMMQSVSPQELVKKYLWAKLIELGELSQLQKEVARSWVPKEQSMRIADMGNVVVFNQQSFDQFLVAIKESIPANEDPHSYFDVVNLKALYEKTVGEKGEKVKDKFGGWVDNLEPSFKKEILFNRVINSPGWSKYYVLKKSKAYFSKSPNAKATVIYNFIDENMMTSTVEGKYV